MKAILARLASVKTSTCSIILGVLLVSNLSLIIGYIIWKGDYDLSSLPLVESWTSYGVLRPLEEREIIVMSFEEERNRARATTEEGLIYDMKRCSLTMGMTDDELYASMSNLTKVATKVSLFLYALWSVIPREYAAAIKNPCWMSNSTLSSRLQAALKAGWQGGASKMLKMAKGVLQMSGGSWGQQLHCLPYFFIAGYPKSGTTTLHEALQEHPEIVRPMRKEPHWWTRAHLGDMDRHHLKHTVMEYISYFSGVARTLSKKPSAGFITYDASQSTLWDSNFFMDNEDYCAMPALISRILPNAKFIVLMRNPITREYSNFYYTCGQFPRLWPRSVQEDPAGQFHKAVTADTKVFSRCLKTASLHECLRRVRRFKNGCGTGHIGKRLPIGLYYVHIHKWLQFYPKKNFLFLRTEDMCREPQKTMTKITKFLGVKPVSKEQAREWFCHKANEQSVYTSDSERFKMKPETWKLLEDFYAPFNERLAKLTGSRCFLWQ